MASPKKKTAASKPATKKSAAKKTVTRKPTAKKTVTRTPTAKKTVTKKPVAAKTVTKKPVVATPPPAPKSREEQRRDGARDLALRVAAAGLGKKAERIEIIDVFGKADYTDFLVLMSGRSDRQVQSIAQAIEQELATKGVRAQNIEGLRQGLWVLVDFGDVLVHVFLEEERRHRDLESLWMDARRVPFEDEAADPKTRAAAL
jgi:ribosome-associated protein